AWTARPDWRNDARAPGLSSSITTTMNEALHARSTYIHRRCPRARLVHLSGPRGRSAAQRAAQAGRGGAAGLSRNLEDTGGSGHRHWSAAGAGQGQRNAGRASRSAGCRGHGHPGHAVGRRKGSGPANSLLMVHYDTVFAEGTAAKRPFHTDEKRAYGPGVADAKGGVAMILHAIKLLQEQQFDGFGTLTVLFNPDEEMG